jgi:tetratricopeptide (TPR) repeat protein
MNKKSYKINLLKITAAFVVLITAGCSNEFLEDKNTKGITDQVVFSSDLTAIAAINGIYDVLQSESDGREYLTKSLFVPANYTTQDYEDSGADTEFKTYNIGTDSGRFNNLWIVNYKGIGRANIALQKIPKAIEKGVISKDLGNRLIAESKFLRGLLYTMLAQNFGGVPVVVNPSGGDVEVDNYAPRNTQDETFAQVVADMEAAIANLPWSYGSEDKGRATKAAAYHYLGNAYMWMKQYDKAAKAFEALEGHAQLEVNFLDVHAAANRNGKESLFEIQFYNKLADGGWGSNDNVTALQSFCMPSEISGWGGYINSTKVLYDSFELGDKRKFATVIGPGDVHPDPVCQIKDFPNNHIYIDAPANTIKMNTAGTILKPWTAVSNAGFFCVKTWRDPELTGNGNGKIFGGQNLIIARYGESLLSLAECYLNLGRTPEAITIVNKIRTRAGLGSLTTLTITNILDEYRHELAGEFTQWYLYRRSGKATEYIKLRHNITIQTGRELMPLPKSQIDANPNLTQNASY